MIRTRNSMKIVLASRNRKKINELKNLLSKTLGEVEILSLDDVGITEEIEENGTTFEENALIKARAAAVSGYIAVGDDSGLTVDALDGAPGIYSARYAARCNFAGDHDDEGNNQALLANLAGKPAEQRGGAFVCTIACVLPNGHEIVVRGEARGRILESYHGNGGFGYDPLFFYEPLGKTFAELSFDEKNEVSHRGRAIVAFAQKLKEHLESL